VPNIDPNAFFEAGRRKSGAPIARSIARAIQNAAAIKEQRANRLFEEGQAKMSNAISLLNVVKDKKLSRGTRLAAYNKARTFFPELPDRTADSFKPGNKGDKVIQDFSVAISGLGDEFNASVADVTDLREKIRTARRLDSESTALANQAKRDYFLAEEKPAASGIFTETEFAAPLEAELKGQAKVDAGGSLRAAELAHEVEKLDFKKKQYLEKIKKETKGKDLAPSYIIGITKDMRDAFTEEVISPETNQVVQRYDKRGAVAAFLDTFGSAKNVDRELLQVIARGLLDFKGSIAPLEAPQPETADTKEKIKAAFQAGTITEEEAISQIKKLRNK
jgi:hypothetical protein